MSANTKSRKFIISVAWPYANGDLHLGHPAGYLLPAGILNDYLRLKGHDVIMVSGSDMHGTPVAVKAWKEGKKPEDYAQYQHKRHAEVMKVLRADYSLYTSTATSIHQKVTQELFKKLYDNGYILTQKTEQFWSEKEHKFLLDRYIEGQCPICNYEKARGDQCDNCGNPLTPEELIKPYSIFGDTELIKRASTNYYLDLQKLQPLLEKHYDEPGVLDDWRKHVVSTTKAWFKEGLEPRAITRDMEGYGVKLPVGFEFDGEPGKVFYVWFEAVTGYFSASVELSVRAGKHDAGDTAHFNFGELGLDEGAVANESSYEGQSLNWRDYWLDADTFSYYFMGKDNIPFHSVIWPGMLIGSGENINLPGNVAANQFLNFKGTKFSKSLGNLIDTKGFFERYGEDTARFYLISRMPENKDYDFTWEEFVDANNNELVANLGNFVNRTLVFWNKQFVDYDFDENSAAGEVVDSTVMSEIAATYEKVGESLEKIKFGDAWAEVMKLSNFANKYFNDTEIWRQAKEDKPAAAKIMANLVYLVANLSRLTLPFLPRFSKEVANYLQLPEVKLAVGRDNWRPVTPDLGRIGEITDLKPLIQKFELEQILLEVDGAE